jgi:NitT/TauT family transport system ATP-binding protein
MMGESVFKITDVSKAFSRKKEKQVILDKFSFSAAPQEVIGIMGPSGCGKTTLLKILGGITQADEGSLSVFGTDCSKKMPKSIKQRIGFVFQENNLQPWRSVEDNLKLPLEMHYFKDEADNKARIDEALEIVGLSNYRRALPQELSGGMMQRVGIARALALRPDILLLDQNFGALDALTRKKLRLDFLQIFERSKNTIVIVTNSIDEALLFSNRILVLSEQPARIEHIVNVDIPFNKRTKEVAFDPQFQMLRKQMIEIVSRQYQREQKEEGCV